MINLDPTLVDQDSIRKQKRKRLLTIYAAPVAILLIISGFFLSTSVFNLVYSLEYSGKAYDMANSFTNTRFLLNTIEPYIAYYDRGVVELLSKDYQKAEEDFTESLKNSPTEDRICMIYVNLSLSIEYQGDQALAGKNYDQALLLYNRAKANLTNNGCASNENGHGSDAKAEDARLRIEQKRSDAISEMNGAESGDAPGNTTGDNNQRVTDGDLENIRHRRIKPDLIRENRGNRPNCLEDINKKCY